MKTVTRSLWIVCSSCCVPLPVEIADDLLALGQHAFDRRPRRAVGIAEHRRMFEQLTGLDHMVEARAVDEMIGDTVDLVRGGAALW